MNLLHTTILSLSTLVASAADATAPANQPIATLGADVDFDRVGGPGRERVRVPANTTRVYHIAFHGGELARVTVRGDGDTDLDVFVYDENGHKIGQDTDSSDFCIVSWTPRWTGPFRIEVRNFGSVYNEYTLETN